MKKSYELCKELGKKLKNMRKSFGDTQEDLTEGLDLCSFNTIGLLERGISSQILLYLPIILKYYGKTFEQFISEY